jgi:hypothetical protein
LHSSTEIQCEDDEKLKDNNGIDSTDVLMNDLSNKHGNIIDSTTFNVQVEEMLQDTELHPLTTEQFKQNVLNKVETNERTIKNNERQFHKDYPTSIKCSNVNDHEEASDSRNDQIQPLSSIITINRHKRKKIIIYPMSSTTMLRTTLILSMLIIVIMMSHRVTMKVYQIVTKP